MKTMKKLAAVASISSVLALAGCANGTAPVNNAQLGAIGGALAGGLVGNQFGEGDGKTVMTIAGSIIGGYLGGMWGQQWDNRDRQQISNSVAYGQPVSWQNNGNNYRSRPSTSYNGYVNGQQTECKDVYIDGYSQSGQHQQVKSRACRIPGTNQWSFQ